MDLNGKFLNAGVLGINLSLWRALDITKKYLEVGNLYSGGFKGASQPLLNVALHNLFKEVDKSWGHILFSSNAKVDNKENKILYFVGSPKPWNVFGSILHGDCELRLKYIDHTAIGKNDPWIHYPSIKDLYLHLVQL